MQSDNFIYKEITTIIIRSFFEVYTELGYGFLESVYEKAMLVVLTGYGLRVVNQREIPVVFRHKKIGIFKSDIVVENKIILELKAARNIDSSHIAQLINYLKASNMDVGYILNFGRKPEFKRLIYN